ncbi:hypothetical protein CFOL_v3_33364 [Cephalotus follicularis]|uniref:Uncharacterized protein n=1 Tax=Cephalotus follicularis TaxID=3775 RepID=A0A1Q3DCA9_CEPFO|nr:hypothetical protein CFOL_v3_33364 [Cephalotus follicularis]
MGITEFVSLRRNWVLTLVFCSLTPMVKSQINGCSVESIDLEQCLNQGNSLFSIDTCCKSLNQVVQAGFNCLCLLVQSSTHILSTPLSLPLSNCHISAPPMTLCRVLATMPVVLPPDIPKEITQPSKPANDVLMPQPPKERQFLLNYSTGDSNSGNLQAQKSNENHVPILSLSNRSNETSSGDDVSKILLHQTLFLFLALHACILLA